MPGREGEHRIRCRHMWPVPAPTTSSVAASDSVAVISPDSFSKDDRKICVGDCALFKPPQDSPPFIGIIRRLILREEGNLSLSVNWLYRPADIKLGKGTLPEAAPNEVFYSFHKDETPAASLLHPCKVAFLCKGVELPSGISSFVCRRVYDTENKRLWWLTDKDYINEQQEEVDRLLERTRLEMHGAAQSGGKSPKCLTGPGGTQLSRSGSESLRNSSSPHPSQVKGKKRDRTDQGFDPVKRECITRADDTESGQFRSDLILKSEIAKLTDKGGLVDFEGVEKLVQLMQPNSSERKIDLACRIMLADVIVVTERFDCLGQFVQLRGLPVLDEWLQEAHKGKIGDASSPKESDKYVDELLLVLLRALDKLPVNLHALQTCNVGKSVNNLRSHKNSEIQKKARSLVDTWKKRVEAEMNMIDAKNGSNHGGSWPSKSVLSEVSHVGNRCNGGSSEVSSKSSTVQSSACKTSSSKYGTGETVAKVASSPGSTKSAASVSSSGDANGRDPNSVPMAGGGSSDPPLSTIKEEKSSSSSQSQNNSLSYSSDHAKTGASCREDVRSSSAGSVSIVKTSGGALRHRKLNNGLQGSAISGGQRETKLGKVTSSSRNLASDNVSPTKGTQQRVIDASLVDHGNGQRLIVRLPNAVRNPAPCANGGCIDDSSVTLSKASPSAEAEMLDHQDRKAKGKGDTFQVSSASNSNTDFCKGADELVGCDKGRAASPGAVCKERSSRVADVDDKMMAASKGTDSSSGVALKMGKSYDTSFSPMNALVESCVKFSEASTTASGGDDIGMNLLASVAAGEISRSDVSPSRSPVRNSPIPDESCSGNDVKSRHHVEDTAQSDDPTMDGPTCSAMPECGNSVDLLRDKTQSSQDAITVSTNFTEGGNVSSIDCKENRRDCSGIKCNFSSNTTLLHNEWGSHLKCDAGPCQESSLIVVSTEDAKRAGDVEIEGSEKFHEQRKPAAGGMDHVVVNNNASPSELKSTSPLSDENMVSNHANEKNQEWSVLVFPEEAARVKVENESKAESPSCSSSEMGRGNNHNEESGCGKFSDERLLTTARIELESIGAECERTVLPSSSSSVPILELKAEMAIDVKAMNQTVQSGKQNIDLDKTILSPNVKCCEKSEVKVVLGHHPDVSVSHEDPPRTPVEPTEECMKSNGGKLDGIDAVGTTRGESDMNSASGSEAASGVGVKLDFDLNEGFPVEDGCQGDLAKSLQPGTMSTVPLPCPLQFSMSSKSVTIPASITVASAAKGPFFPPENPLRSKGELGWKGSAATSAFRPAEPRKPLEMPVSFTGSAPVDNATSKQGRIPLDIDLNVPDERVIEDVASQNSSRVMCLEPRDRHGGGLDLDLNRVDDSPDVGQFSASNRCKVEISQLSNRSLLSGGSSNAELNASRDIDLNSGPVPDEGVTDAAARAKGNLSFLSPLPGLRMNTMDQGNFSAWFPPSNSYSAIAVPSVLPGRGEQNYPIANGSQRILGGPGGTSFGPDYYRGLVLSSSPAVPFPPTGPFQYPGFPFETSFSLPSNSYSSGSTAYVESSSGGSLCFPPMTSHFVGPAGVVPSHFSRHYFMNLPGGASSLGSDGRKWGAQTLDLNGPGSTDTERRDERLPAAIRQMPVPVSQAPADEQIKLYQTAGGVLKRREPDGGWDADRINYKQPSWH